MGDSRDDGFGKFVPGFDFLQNLAKGATQSMPQIPNLASWVSPSLNVEELEKRIGELRAVHFWLEQNGRALGATIQALEVQKMTLATLKGMNFNIGDMANAFSLKSVDSAAPGDKVATDAASDAPRAASDTATATSAATNGGKKAKSSSAASSLIDPMHLWGSLTQQFQQIAASALQDATRQTSAHASRNGDTGLVKEAVKKNKKATGSRKPPSKTASSVKAQRRSSR